MAGSVNKVILIGNLGGDPEVKSHTRGGKYARMSIATSKSWREKETGERKEKTEWHRVVIWNVGLVKIAEQYLKKGAKVYVEGELQTHEWTDDKGSKHHTTEIVLTAFNSTLTMLDSQRHEPNRPEDGATARPATGARRNDDMNDDIPF